MAATACPLCDGAGGEVVFVGAAFRVVRTDEGGFPAFYRLIWQRHVAELSDLAAAERHLCVDALVALEQAMRAHLHPTKINIASLGNLVPHLHWHVIARFDWDSHFPAPVWAAAQRQPSTADVARVVGARSLLEADIARRLSAVLRTGTA